MENQAIESPQAPSEIKQKSNKEGKKISKLDEQGKEKTDSAATESKKTTVRPIKEIIGIVKGKTKQRTFVVIFADSNKEETVPMAQMHKHYTKELLNFYEDHLTQVISPANGENV